MIIILVVEQASDFSVLNLAQNAVTLKGGGGGGGGVNISVIMTSIFPQRLWTSPLTLIILNAGESS